MTILIWQCAIIVIDEHDSTDSKHERTTGGLAIWRGDEYILNFLFANRLQSGLDFYY